MSTLRTLGHLNNSGEPTPIFVEVGFQARNKIASQIHNNAVFDGLSYSNAVCKIGSENYPVDGINCDYDREKYDQAYHENENVFLLHAETNLLNPFISLQKFRTDYNFYVFDFTKQKPPITSQPIKLEYKFSVAIDVAEYVAYAIVLTPKLISISSFVQRHLDLL